MKNSSQNNLLFKEMIYNLKKRLDLKAVILFGSRGRGEFNEFSDYDVVIIGNFKQNYFKRVRWVLDFTPVIPIDIFCYTQEEFDEMFNSYKLTAIDAIGDGIPLYGNELFQTYKEKYTEFIKHGMKKLSCTLIPPHIEDN